MSKRPKSEPSALIAALNARCERERLSNQAVGDKIGASGESVRLCRKMGRPPKNKWVREKLARWLGMNGYADRQAANGGGR